MKQQRIKKVHFVGIGGTGMSGIAEVLLNKGYLVSGSDLNNNPATERLQNMGADIFIGHDGSYIKNADLLVVSSAIRRTHPEVKAAHEACIPVMRRAQMLGELMRMQQGIAVAGTHGKTTTTSLLASLLTEGGLDPTFVIGGLLTSAGANAQLGTGKYFVAEADESDASFLYLHPQMTIVTNIDADHMRTYHNDFKRLEKTFLDFLHHLPFYGLAVVCLDDPIIKKILPDIARPIITYGFDKASSLRAYNFKQQGTAATFNVVSKSKQKDFAVTLNLPGKHNATNALAAIAIALECGVQEDAICKALTNFAGVGRRFQMHGPLNFRHGQSLLIDDYGHHPREIGVTLQAIRKAWPKKRLILAFQPHRYSRTQALFEDFTKVLAEPDVLLLLDVYPAGEKAIAGVDGRVLAGSIRKRGKVDPIFVPNIDELELTLDDIIKDDDLLLMQGAGSIGKIAAHLAQTRI